MRKSKAKNRKRAAAVAGAAICSAHVSHNLLLSREEHITTIADLMRLVKSANIPETTKLQAPYGNSFRGIQNISYCRDANELSMW